ncbi:GBS Bsp-like repeat-containing protein [Enterococcus cecorum]|uniref:GBS Bsp-like repeat-containing protein n=7 Tax=Enterococcus cecorum TaxID=44008 RepID=A0AAW9JNL2_9ENTE|nr:GBS Bsp-like repeat-containing protein [Enterococcus cecorum]MCJ0577829.1 GBS Bsp-like repeat-containing protein [Enterococcus cecorum]MCJ0598662.1 GBS Bsp-like repeat-containing protein [Enterococcus cecorum]MDZ5509333.1 GBS Bsp-like repeat-containing protein [Enterococcus cecorum]MDZ5548599.1 GBS Bsp-like repeat-containing protein [Enterococcus cecorum]MDZ5571631.1 GBS Bsp-like repeat-containing protein [Enterococcus cecorum]
MKMKKWMTLGVCVTTLSMLTGIYPTFQSVHADDTQSTSTTNTLNETSTTTSTTSVTKSEETISITPNTANTTSEVAVQAAVQSVKPIEGTIKNVNQENGTYDVVVKVNENVQSGIKQVLVPIWSDAQQKDIKWYEAKLQDDGTWIVHMNFSEHQYHRATFHTHVYVYSNDNKHNIGTVLNDTTIESRETKLSAKIQNVNTSKGSYDVVIYGSSSSGIHHVKVPIWSSKDQSDIKWYDAVKQPDGSYLVHMNIANHKYHHGVYHTHVYMYNNDHSGRAIVVNDTNLPETNNTKLDARITNVNISNGSYDVIIKGQIDSGVREILVPIWSDENQKDIKWYKASKQSDGSYVVHMNIANHKYNRGTYTTHVYMYGNNGKQHGMVVGNTALPDVNTKLDAEIKHVNKDKGSYDVVIKGQIDSGVREILVPIWSDKNQKDIKWYKASKQADGSYIVHMNIANHKYNRGTYTTHVYMYGNNGKQHGMVVGNTILPDVHSKLEAEIKNVNQAEGSYDVVINGQIDSGIKEILVPIWSAKDQNDIKWYKAEKQVDGSYVVHMNIANHKYNRGTYTTHVYMYSNNGKQHGIVVGNVEIKNIPNTLSGKIINVNQTNSSYDVVIDAFSNSGIREILIPIWSRNDQSDIKWYKAEEGADGKWHVHMQAANHNFNSGAFYTHVYMYMNNGKFEFLNLGQTVLSDISKSSGNSARIVNVDFDNGNYDVLVKVDNKLNVSKILVPTWSSIDQSDIVWHEAKNIGNGYYKAHISVMDHQLLSGIYKSDVYIYQFGVKNPIGLPAGSINLSKPYKIIDISEHQKPDLINYDELAKHIRGVIVRIQYGQNYVDMHYKKHITELKKRNIPVAVYAWVRGQDYNQMVNEAKLFYNRAKEFNPSFWWLDVEEPGLMTQANNNVRSGVELYRSTLSNLGAKKIGLYIGNDKYKLYNVDTSKFQGIWIPTYGLDNGLYQGYNPTSTNVYDLHQYTSNGKINGYGYNLDISRLVNKNFDYFF